MCRPRFLYISAKAACFSADSVFETSISVMLFIFFGFFDLSALLKCVADSLTSQRKQSFNNCSYVPSVRSLIGSMMYYKRSLQNYGNQSSTCAIKWVCTQEKWVVDTNFSNYSLCWFYFWLYKYFSLIDRRSLPFLFMKGVFHELRWFLWETHDFFQ